MGGSSRGVTNPGGGERGRGEGGRTDDEEKPLHTWTPKNGGLCRGWPKLRHVSGGMPVFSLQHKVTDRKAVDPPRLNPGFLPQGSRRKHSPHSRGRGWGGLGWAGAVQGARAGHGLGWCRWPVQAAWLAGWPAGLGWCRWLVQVAGAGGQLWLSVSMMMLMMLMMMICMTTTTLLFDARSVATGRGFKHARHRRRRGGTPASPGPPAPRPQAPGGRRATPWSPGPASRRPRRPGQAVRLAPQT